MDLGYANKGKYVVGGTASNIGSASWRTEVPRLHSQEPCVVKKGLAKSPTEVPVLRSPEPCVVGKGLTRSPTSWRFWTGL